MYSGVGRNGGAHVYPDRSRVDQLDMFDAIGIYLKDMLRQSASGYPGFKSRNKAFKNHRGFSGAGNACHNRQPPLRNIGFQRFYRVNLRCGKVNCPG